MSDNEFGPAEPTAANKKPSKKVLSAISGKEYSRRDLVSLDEVRPNLAERIRADNPGLPNDALIARAELSGYRTLYVEDLLKAEHGELTELDRQVAESLATHETLAENIDEEFEDRRTIGERLSDRMASFGGSWTFLILFATTLAIWMGLNLLFPPSDRFDAFPFLLLNLALSCLAAVQAPVIMMSQNRQAAKDRLQSQNDYRVNLKAELEIRHVHEKLDHLISRQWQRLAEIQQMQLEIMQEMTQRRRQK